MKKHLFLIVFWIFIVNIGIAYAAIIPNPIISRGKTVYTSNGTAALLVDNKFGGSSFSISNGSWIAINVGTGYSKVFFNWNNPNYNWSDVIAAAHSCKQGLSCPVDYTILTSTNSTNGTDGTWTTMATITGNTVTARGHVINFSGASWIKMNITSGGGFIDEIEVFDLSNNGTDIWFFPGTSISANSFKASVPEQNFADVVNTNHSAYNPAMIRGGIPCINSGDLATDISKYLEMTGNVKYWCIEMGTNDAWGGSNSNVAFYKTNMQQVIDACKAVGISPIISRMIGTNASAAGWQIHPDYLTAIDDLTTQNNLIPGPDFYTWFSNHPGDLTSDGVHTNASGAASMQRLWAETMSSIYSGTSIPVTGVSLSSTTLTIGINATSQLTATIVPSNSTNKSVNWASSNSTIASVSTSGLITGKAVGSATITVTTVDGLKTATCEVTVNNITIPVSGVAVTPASASVNVGAADALVATVSPSNATNKSVSWSSSNTAIATVNSVGVVTGVTAGSATITVTTASGSFTATSIITVNTASSPCSNPAAVSLPLTQNGSGEYCWSTNGTITFINSWNMDLVEVNGVAFTNVWANNMPAKLDGNYYIHYKASVSWAHLEVNGAGGGNDVPVNGISVTPTSANVNVGSTTALTATIAPSNATNKSVSWSSSNTIIATVNSTGVVTGVSDGSAIITVTTTSGSFTANSIITVNTTTIPVSGVTVNPTTLTLYINHPCPTMNTGTLTATVLPSNASNKNVTWSSSNSSVATVTNTGIVVAFSNGSAVITATTQDGNKIATCNVSVPVLVPVIGVTVSPTTSSINVGQTIQLTATVIPICLENRSVTWSSSNTAVATVSSTGLVTAVAPGSASITVTTVDGAITATSLITVSSTDIPVTGLSVTPTTVNISVGSIVTLTVIITPGNATNKTIIWRSSNTNVATVSNAGISGISAGSATITATSVSGSFTVTIAVIVTGSTTAPCSNPVSITVPFSQNGAGEYCWSTTQSMAYVNSWNTDLVEINGVDYTNKWSNTMPDAIDGKWYIHYKASVAWAHFEAPALKEADSEEFIINSTGSLKVYPNPFRDQITIELNGVEKIERIEILNVLGQVKQVVSPDQFIQDRLVLPISAKDDLLIIKIYTEEKILKELLIRYQ